MHYYPSHYLVVVAIEAFDSLWRQTHCDHVLTCSSFEQQNITTNKTHKHHQLNKLRKHRLDVTQIQVKAMVLIALFVARDQISRQQPHLGKQRAWSCSSSLFFSRLFFVFVLFFNSSFLQKQKKEKYKNLARDQMREDSRNSCPQPCRDHERVHTRRGHKPHITRAQK